MSVLELEKPFDRPAVDTAAQNYYINARRNFSYFRLLMRPDMLWNWWAISSRFNSTLRRYVLPNRNGVVPAESLALAILGCVYSRACERNSAVDKLGIPGLRPAPSRAPPLFGRLPPFTFPIVDSLFNYSIAAAPRPIRFRGR